MNNSQVRNLIEERVSMCAYVCEYVWVQSTQALAASIILIVHGFKEESFHCANLCLILPTYSHSVCRPGSMHSRGGPIFIMLFDKPTDLIQWTKHILKLLDGYTFKTLRPSQWNYYIHSTTNAKLHIAVVRAFDPPHFILWQEYRRAFMHTHSGRFY